MAGRSRVNREVHARFCEGLGVRFPWATRHIRIFQKWHIELKFFSLDAYYDIKLYPLFHNQWDRPLYIVVARCRGKSYAVYILLCNFHVSIISGVGTLYTIRNNQEYLRLT